MGRSHLSFSEWLLCALIAAIPFGGFTAFWAMGYPISVPLAVSVALFFVLIIKAFLPSALRLDKVSILALVLVIPGVISGFGAIVQGVNLQGCFRSLTYAIYFPLLFILFSQHRFNEANLRKFLWFILWIGSVVAVVGIYQAFANIGVGLPQLYFHLTSSITGFQRQYAFGASGTYLRPTSFFAEPSWFGHYLIPIIFAGIMLFTRTKRVVLLINLLLINAFALLATFSLGAYLSFAGALSLVWLLRARNHLRDLFIGGISFTLLGILAYIFAPDLVHTLSHNMVARFDLIIRSTTEFLRYPSFSNLALSSTVYRAGTSWLAILLWTHSPVTILVGWGVGEFGNAVQAVYSTYVRFSGTGWTSVMAEQGIVGLLFYMLFFWNLFVNIGGKTHRLGFSHSRREGVDSFALTALIIFFILDGFTGGLGFERSLPFWVLLSITNILRRSVTVVSDTTYG